MALLSFSGLILCSRMSESEQHKYVGSEQNNVTNNKRSDDIFSDGFSSNLSFFLSLSAPKVSPKFTSFHVMVRIPETTVIIKGERKTSSANVSEGKAKSGNLFAAAVNRHTQGVKLHCKFFPSRGVLFYYFRCCCLLLVCRWCKALGNRKKYLSSYHNKT